MNYMMWSVKRAPENGDGKACFSFEQHSVRERLGLIEGGKEELSDGSLVSGSPQLVAPICSCHPGMRLQPGISTGSVPPQAAQYCVTFGRRP